MASRKIIFFVVVGISAILIILGIISIANKEGKIKDNKLTSLSIWVVWGTTEDYWKVFSGFNGIDPIYKETVLDIRVFPNYSSYRDILLSTLADGNGPDIFMIEGGGDDVLSQKSVAVPEPYISLVDFEKRFEDIFLTLLSTVWEGKEMKKTLLWVPLWYETLWLFYNKAFFSTLPKTWNEIDLLYTNALWYFPVNIWLWPRYTPDATDIIAYFLLKNNVSQTKDLLSGGTALEEYLEFGSQELRIASDVVPIEGATLEEWFDSVENVLSDTLPKNLKSLKDEYDSTGYSTIDSFIRGKIGMIVWFPSIIREIEKSEKRAWPDAISSLVLTERLPQDSLSKWRTNIARYRYLAISAKSQNQMAWADFLNYLLQEKTLATMADAFPYLISPDRSISQSQWQKGFSTVFARAKLDAFIPLSWETLAIFNYWLKSEYEKIFEDSIDRTEKIDISNILSRIKDAVECKIESTIWWVLSSKCLK